MASVKIDITSPEPYITPAEIYSGSDFNVNPPFTPPIALRIATGGAGQSGLLRSLANAFIEFEMRMTGCPRFSVAWLLSDTSASFNYLGSRAADCSITYHKVAEEMAMKQGIAERREYAWRDHWLLVGPKENPARLPLDDSYPDTTSQPIILKNLLFGQLLVKLHGHILIQVGTIDM